MRRIGRWAKGAFYSALVALGAWSWDSQFSLRTWAIVAVAAVAFCWTLVGVARLPERLRLRRSFAYIFGARHFRHYLSTTGCIVGIALLLTTTGHAADRVGTALISLFGVDLVATWWKRYSAYTVQWSLWLLGDPNVRRPRKQLPPLGSSPDRRA